MHCKVRNINNFAQKRINIGFKGVFGDITGELNNFTPNTICYIKFIHVLLIQLLSMDIFVNLRDDSGLLGNILEYLTYVCVPTMLPEMAEATRQKALNYNRKNHTDVNDVNCDTWRV